MVEFKNQVEVDAWLKGQPREVAVVIVARAALRALPLLAIEFSEHSRWQSGRGSDGVSGDIVMPVFRAVTLSWVAGRHPEETHRATIGFRALAGDAGAGAAHAAADAAGGKTARAIDDAASGAYKIVDAGMTLDLAAMAALASGSRAACAADHANQTVSAVGPPSSATRAAAGTEAAAKAAAGVGGALDLWVSVSGDATRIEEGMAPEKLAGEALWLDGRIPDWAKQHWADLKQKLLGLDEGWQLWTDWYMA